MASRHVVIPLLLGLLAALAILPWLAGNYVVSYFILLFMYLSLASGWNIITGYVGYLALGHAAFFGVGAYIAALLITRYEVFWPVAVLAGGLGAALCALVMGGLCLRLRSIFFAVATLAFAEAIRVCVSSWDSLTHGGLGISLKPCSYLLPFYYAMGTCAAGTVLMTYLIARSDFGLRLLAIREDETAAESIGVDTTKAKLLAFVLSAVPCGIAGGIYAPYLSYIEPLSVFNIGITTQLIVMATFGGAGTIVGPVIGTVLLTFVEEVLWANFPFVHRVLFGALIVATVRLMPQGVVAVLMSKGLLPRSRRV